MASAGLTLTLPYIRARRRSSWRPTAPPFRSTTSKNGGYSEDSDVSTSPPNGYISVQSGPMSPPLSLTLTNAPPTIPGTPTLVPTSAQLPHGSGSCDSPSSINQSSDDHPDSSMSDSTPIVASGSDSTEDDLPYTHTLPEYDTQLLASKLSSPLYSPYEVYDTMVDPPSGEVSEPTTQHDNTARPTRPHEALAHLASSTPAPISMPVTIPVSQTLAVPLPLPLPQSVTMPPTSTSGSLPALPMLPLMAYGTLQGALGRGSYSQVDRYKMPSSPHHRISSTGPLDRSRPRRSSAVRPGPSEGVAVKTARLPDGAWSKITADLLTEVAMLRLVGSSRGKTYLGAQYCVQLIDVSANRGKDSQHHKVKLYTTSHKKPTRGGSGGSGGSTSHYASSTSGSSNSRSTKVTDTTSNSEEFTSPPIPRVIIPLAQHSLGTIAPTLSSWEKYEAFEGIVLALQYLHEALHMVHCDIKPHNILWYAHTPGARGRGMAKLADFGAATFYGGAIHDATGAMGWGRPPSVSSPRGEPLFPYGLSHYHTTIADTYYDPTLSSPYSPGMGEKVYTLWYRPPEVLVGAYHHRLTASDIWALACTFYEIFVSLPLFPGQDEEDQIYRIWNSLGTNTMPPEWLVTPYEETTPEMDLTLDPLHHALYALREDDEGAAHTVASFIRNALVYDPFLRPKASEVLGQPMGRHVLPVTSSQAQSLPILPSIGSTLTPDLAAILVPPIALPHSHVEPQSIPASLGSPRRYRLKPVKSDERRPIIVRNKALNWMCGVYMRLLSQPLLVENGITLNLEVLLRTVALYDALPSKGDTYRDWLTGLASLVLCLCYVERIDPHNLDILEASRAFYPPHEVNDTMLDILERVHYDLSFEMPYDRLPEEYATLIGAEWCLVSGIMLLTLLTNAIRLKRLSAKTHLALAVGVSRSMVGKSLLGAPNRVGETGCERALRRHAPSILRDIALRSGVIVPPIVHGQMADPHRTPTPRGPQSTQMRHVAALFQSMTTLSLEEFLSNPVVQVLQGVHPAPHSRHPHHYRVGQSAVPPIISELLEGGGSPRGRPRASSW